MADRIDWESFSGLLSDHDLINVTVETGAWPAAIVEFRLRAGEGIRWWKALYVASGIAPVGFEIWTRDDRTEDSVMVPAMMLLGGSSIELRKAKFLAFPTGMYLLGDLARLTGGSRVTFQWVQDEEAPHFASVMGAQIDLPIRGGRYHVVANQGFQARVTYWSIDGPYWTSDARYKLGAYSPPDNTTWGVSRVQLPYTGRVVEFVINAQAPATPGEYPFQWRMVQEGVAWFGEVFGPIVVVDPEPVVDPPPPPDSGDLDLRLVRQGTTGTYEASAPDPTSRHVRIVDVTNTSGHRLFLAHQDRLLRQAGYELVEPNAKATPAFAGLEVEGQWRAQYRGSTTPPPELSIAVAWHVP